MSEGGRNRKDLAYHPVVRGVAAALKERCGVRAGARVVVGVSGGADSVALLLAMVFLSRRRGRGMEIAVGHVQHHLRECAEADADFVRELAQTLGVAFMRADLDLSLAKGNVEAAARKGRYAALAEMARGFGAGFVVTAHHGDDQMETVLLNLARGTGTRGLRGMAWRRRLGESAGGTGLKQEHPHPNPPFEGEGAGNQSAVVWLLRPMLGVEKEEILDFLRMQGQQFRTDPTNGDTTRARAKLRAEVLPAIKAIHPRAARNVARAAGQVTDAHKALAKQGKALFGGDRVERGALREAPEAAVAAGLRQWLLARGVDTDRLGAKVVGAMVKAMRDGAGGERGFEFSRGVRVVVTREWVEWKRC